MAVSRIARILSTAPMGERGRLLHLQVQGEEALGFTGGQYLIFNTGVPRADGKAHKRAYSLVSSDEDQRTFSLCVYRLAEGPGSAVLHEAPVGTELPFSGPWGSFLPDDSTPRSTLVVATDSGITAALGLLRGRAFAPQRTRTQVVWFSESPTVFLPAAWVRQEVEALGCRFQHHSCPPPNHPERTAHALALALEAARAHATERVYLSGDGAVLHPLKQSLVDSGLEAGGIRLESFFNNPARKAAA
ncbi:FAD-dependent oxidoreductase [Vitiosangium sp. GDMCC 1.1324]|uniref:FAD-dependent oxidoreductase n=1 Tax=Vitiosangium sp. (strain GDMCC 1.1324) TaxID=2138576 RepID=UPI000D35C91F|nr:FAD-dependent oxidoreductase [Vitiosangium sp. GDMCC 1.1324]PTL85629.1 oxidoreductase [Vitiosangium sp. GDMCC 1.1324]